jgi:beta-lactamase regulating signal transducer with metallopeptidase domain
MLTRLILLAAQTGPDVQTQLQPQQPSNLFGLGLREILLLVGLIAIIALSLYVFAYLTRRKRRRHLSRSGPEMWGADRHAQSERPEGRVRLRKKRRKHPDFRPRNPTLGETGGLPPVRPDEPAQPAT